MKNICKNCKKETDNPIFCSHSCSTTYNNKTRKRKKKSYIFKKCPYCGKEFSTHHRRKNKIYCSYRCYVLSLVKIRNCLVCGKELTRKSQTDFCSNGCYNINKYNTNISKWISGEILGYSNHPNHGIKGFIRLYLHTRSNRACEKCGFFGINPFSNKSILQVHHKDGDSTHVTPGNLELLCPNCHAMTNNYMGINRGKSTRTKRYMET